MILTGRLRGKGLADAPARLGRWLLLPACLLLCCFCLQRAGAQTGPLASSNLHQWGAITQFHGLPSNHVRAIAQTPDGALWFGTDNGLARYDGRRVQKMGGEEFALSRVFALALDPDGALWVGSNTGAARVINGIVHPITQTHGKAITAIAAIRRGRVILATDGGEILDCDISPEGQIALHAIGPDDHWLLRAGSKDDAGSGPPIAIASILLTPHDALILGTRGRGLLSLDLTGAANASRSPEFITEIKSRPRAFFINALAADRQGLLWSGADAPIRASGLSTATDPINPEPIGADIGTVSALRADEEGNIWAGTEARGALVVRDHRNVERFTFENTGGGLLSNRVHAVFIDREGVVWFGTDSGASRYDFRSPHVEAVSPAGESNFVRALLMSSTESLWGGANRGLFVRLRDSVWEEAPELHGHVVHALAEDPDGRILAGTASGLFIASTSSGRAGPFAQVRRAGAKSDSIRAIRVFQQKVYIANYGEGVERLDEELSGSGPVTRAPVWPGADGEIHPSLRHVSSLHAEGGRLWIGTAEDGAFAFDGVQTTADPALGSLSGSVVWSIAGSTSDALWFATARGLYAFRRGELSAIIPNIDARSVAVAANGSDSRPSVWCGAVDGGLYRVALDGPGNATLISRIDSEQGLPSQSVFSVLPLYNESRPETLWIGTSHGVARYQPGHVAPVLNVIRALGKRAYTADDVRAGLELEYPQNSLAVEVAAASSRTFPEQFQYAFSLLDATGRPIRRKLARDPQFLVENLAPGRYHVVVEAFSRDLVASDPARFDFAVAPAPFPWTSGALSALLLLALVAMAWGYRQNSRLAGANGTLETTNAELAATRLQLANETETERRRIARDLHDQTLADLRRLMMLTDGLPAATPESARIQPADFRVAIESVSFEVRRICEDLSPSALENVGLAAALEWALAEASASQLAGARFEHECSMESGIEEKAHIDLATAIQLYRIVQEAISNVCKHSNASRVKLAMSATGNDTLWIRLEDDGRGFDAGRNENGGRGLANIRSRASMIHATVEWAPRPGGGSIFMLRR